MFSPPVLTPRQTEQQYGCYAKTAKPYHNNKAFAAMAAMAASHPDLDLLSLTPSHLRQPLIDLLTDWQKHMHIDTQSALDRLYGIYGMCGRCQKYRIQEIGGITMLSGDSFELNGPHICEECRQAGSRVLKRFGGESIRALQPALLHTRSNHMATETRTTSDVVTDIMNATSLRAMIEACAYLYRPQRTALIGLVSKHTWVLEEIGQNKCHASARRLVHEAGESWESFRDALAVVCKTRSDESGERMEIGQANSWLTMAESIRDIP